MLPYLSGLVGKDCAAVVTSFVCHQLFPKAYYNPHTPYGTDYLSLSHYLF